MSNLYYNGEVNIDDIIVEVHAEASGWYRKGDSWGYGCEPPDGEFDIDKVEYINAHHENLDNSVEITEELKDKVVDALCDVRFEESVYEPY